MTTILRTCWMLKDAATIAGCSKRPRRVAVWNVPGFFRPDPSERIMHRLGCRHELITRSLLFYHRSPPVDDVIQSADTKPPVVERFEGHPVDAVLAGFVLLLGK
ncbi:hypothetical protein SAMN05421882_101410 [Nitrosomonas communis]|uniref:Uncharacterized protein n=1 Tax=Nitrosomonas communis TaxID=44574 RepID=A0A1H2U2L7_9PROT|nr:hypothetical protein SAMN05421882_101410 [Nitrosomonas communis]